MAIGVCWTVSLWDIHAAGHVATVVVQAEHAELHLSPLDDQVVRVHVDESDAS